MKKFIITTLVIAVAQICLAQPGGSPLGAPTPIDGGITLLIVAGAVLGGAKKMKDRQKK